LPLGKRLGLLALLFLLRFKGCLLFFSRLMGSTCFLQGGFQAILIF
jgi:hypothetical protein